MNLKNQYLADIDDDHFHHLGFSVKSGNVKRRFQDVKFVVVSGSSKRIQAFVEDLQPQLKTSSDDDGQNLSRTDRFELYKVGPVLLANHGMGAPSTSILLHEIFKILHYAEATNVTFFRLGTCGGLGVEAGTVVISNKVMNGLLKEVHSEIVLGEIVNHPTGFSMDLVDELVALNSDGQSGFAIETGTTMSCDDFYEGQGRLDGAFCSYTKEEKMNFLRKAYDSGVRNIEMEATLFSAMCLRAGVKAALICVPLLNRLENTDQVHLDKDQYMEFQKRPWKVVLQYMKSKLPVESWL